MFDQIGNFFRGFQQQPLQRSGFMSSRSSRFDVSLACYPISFCGKEDLEKGNKIILPSSALEVLAGLNVSWPMVFEISNEDIGKKTHCGVMEFSAQEGTCFVPFWLMQNLFLSEGDIIKVTNTTLPTGTFVKLQPVTSDFLDISNPKIVLEQSLRHYTTLTVGDVISIKHGIKTYEVEIVETKPPNAILIIEADLEVDFVPPKDYVEPDYSKNIAQKTPVTPVPIPEIVTPVGYRLDGKAAKQEIITPVKEEEDNEPWTKKLVQGVRTFDVGYEALVREGRVPGIVGGKNTISDTKQLFIGGGQALGQ